MEKIINGKKILEGVDNVSSDEISQNISVLLKELQERRAGSLIPAEKFKSDNLIEKIEEEVEEVRQALKGNGNLIEEIVDIQLVCETFLAGLGLNQEQRNNARYKAKLKNLARGYYLENKKDELVGL